MSITADPSNRLGDHVVLTITLPTDWVVLTHHGRDVKIEVSRLLEFDNRYGRDPDEFRYQNARWTWTEEVVLREVGWLTTIGLTISWPTTTLHNAVLDWRKRQAV